MNAQKHCSVLSMPMFSRIPAHSANMAVYFAMLEPGDTVMGMNLSHGGHLTHGSPVNMSGKYFNFVPYGVTEEAEVIDYDALEKTALEVKPKMIVAGASALILASLTLRDFAKSQTKQIAF